MQYLQLKKPPIRDIELLKKRLSQTERGSDLRDKNLIDIIRSMQNVRDKRVSLPFRIYIAIGPKLVKYICLGPIPIKRNW